MHGTVGSPQSRHALHLDKLARAYQNQGRLVEAEPLLRLALSITEQAHGPEDQSVAFRLNNLAFLYTDMGRYTEAVAYYERALAISRKTIGANDPDYAQRLVNLARVHVEQGRPHDARPLLREAQGVFEHAEMSRHLNMAYCLHLLGRTFKSTGERAEATTCFQDALAIFVRVLGPESQDAVLTSAYLAGMDQELPVLRQVPVPRRKNR
jgi:tetratricopeptide (TPR) repeat protein